jgi:hypothetical protein
MTDNATSENLRKLARLIAMGQPLNADAVSEAIVLCADAWDASQARVETLREFDADTVRVCSETIWGKHAEEAHEGIRLARHNFLQRLATALAAAPNAPSAATSDASPRQGLEEKG